MNRQYIIRQILYNWTRTLQIEEQSGESFITSEDIDRLNDELISIVEPPRISLLVNSVLERIRNLKARITGIKISANLFHPL
ncbi:MAG: hypothetical protein HZB59_10145 [Ignavibacteriales bacterium]|nr:hypothetical protein [Ignavibacteriales bacterium]